MMRSFWCVVVLLVFSVSAQAKSVTVVEDLLTINSAAQTEGVIAGAGTVFTDERRGNPDIYWYDGLGNVLPLSTWASKEYAPAADGNKVAFVSEYVGDANIHFINLDTGVEELLTVSFGADTSPAISGDNIVFVTNRAGTPDIYWYDLATAGLRIVANTEGYEQRPDIDGDLVAWQVLGLSGDYDVYAAFLNETPFLVAGGAGDQASPSVSGGLIAFYSRGDIFVFDVATGQTTQVTDDAASQQNPIIDGRRVYWQDDSNYNQDIYVHDLDTGATFQLTSDPTNQKLTDAVGNRVVYTDYRFGNANIMTLTYTLNYAPIASAGLDQDIYVGDVAQLAGSAEDLDGDPIASWQWTIDSAPAGSSAVLSAPNIANPTFAPDLPGAYVLSLVVNDGQEDSLPATTTITANENLPPLARVSVTPQNGTEPLDVTLDASGSSDPEGGSLTYAWDLGDGNTAGNVDALVHTYQTAGTYQVILTVTDDNNQTAVDTGLVEVTPRYNNPPTVNLTATPNGGSAPLTVQFAAGAGDQEGDTLSYLWNFGDSATSTLENPQHIYTSLGVYTASLTVSDGTDSTDSTIMINVNVTTGLQIDSAVVQWKPKKDSFGQVRVEGTFSGGTMAPEDVVLLTFDGITLLSVPLSDFNFDGRSKYTHREKDASVTLDVSTGALKAFRRNTSLLGLDNANGVDVVLSFGQVSLAENIVMTPAPGRKMTYSAAP